MNDTSIVTSDVVIDDILKAWDFQDDCRAVGSSGGNPRRLPELAGDL